MYTSTLDTARTYQAVVSDPMPMFQERENRGTHSCHTLVIRLET